MLLLRFLNNIVYNITRRKRRQQIYRFFYESIEKYLNLLNFGKPKTFVLYKLIGKVNKLKKKCFKIKVLKNCIGNL